MIEILVKIRWKITIIVVENREPYYYASIRSLSLRYAILGRFFNIGSAISRCGTTIEQHYSRRK